MKITLTGHVYKYKWDSNFHVMSHMSGDTESRCYVGSFEYEYELPATFNETAQQILALEKRIEQESDTFYKRIQELKDQISDLQCIEHVVPA